MENLLYEYVYLLPINSTHIFIFFFFLFIPNFHIVNVDYESFVDTKAVNVENDKADKS